MMHARRAYWAALSSAATALILTFSLAPSVGCGPGTGGGGSGGQHAGGGGSGGGGAGGGGAGGSGACLANDLPCELDGECCSGVCTLEGACGEPTDCVGTADLYVCPPRVSGNHQVGVTSCPQALGTATVHNGTDAPVDVECIPGNFLLCDLSSTTIPAQGQVTADIAFGCGTTSTFSELVEVAGLGAASSVEVLGAVIFNGSCGDGVCDFSGAEPSTCPEDCCGDGFCDPGEDAVCPADCG